MSLLLDTPVPRTTTNEADRGDGPKLLCLFDSPYISEVSSVFVSSRNNTNA